MRQLLGVSLRWMRRRRPDSYLAARDMRNDLSGGRNRFQCPDMPLNRNCRLKVLEHLELEGDLLSFGRLDRTTSSTDSESSAH